MAYSAATQLNNFDGNEVKSRYVFVCSIFLFSLCCLTLYKVFTCKSETRAPKNKEPQNKD